MPINFCTSSPFYELPIQLTAQQYRDQQDRGGSDVEEFLQISAEGCGFYVFEFYAGSLGRQFDTHNTGIICALLASTLNEQSVNRRRLLLVSTIRLVCELEALTIFEDQVSRGTSGIDMPRRAQIRLSLISA